MTGFPEGHYYSPVPDLADLETRKERIWGPIAEPAGVDLKLDKQRQLLESVRTFASDFRYPLHPPDDAIGTTFFDDNGLFAGLDSRILFCMLRRLRPRRIIEVGGGFSSILSADVNRVYLSGRCEILCIEPYPRDFLKQGVPGISRLIEQKVEDIEPRFFGRLQAGDVLFVDSSHVSKTGSDVNFLYLEVLPRLARGVVVHLHDIFLPHEYPAEWVLGEHRFWNEQYLFQAMMMFSKGFETVFGCTCASLYFPELIESVFGKLHGGSSFWVEKTL
jgi:hypothetical protein